jgi:hypothetical protein
VPANYTGNPAPAGADTPSPDPAFGAVPIGQLPVDATDPRSAAGLYQVLKTGLDWITFLAANAVGNGSFANIKRVILNGLAAAEDAPGWETTRTGASGYVELWAASALAVKVRAYATPTGQYVIGYGCAWDVANLRWNRDAGSGTGYAIRLGLDQISFSVGLVAAHWVDADWTYPLFFDYGIAGGSLAIAKGFTATLGDIVATAGKLKGKRLLGNGTPLANTDVGSITGYGTTPTVAVTGDDMSGTIAITADADAGVANAAFVLTFKDGTWTTAPRVILVLQNDSDAANPRPAFKWSVTATALTVTMLPPPVASATYTFAFVAVGR